MEDLDMRMGGAAILNNSIKKTLPTGDHSLSVAP